MLSSIFSINQMKYAVKTNLKNKLWSNHSYNAIKLLLFYEDKFAWNYEIIYIYLFVF